MITIKCKLCNKVSSDFCGVSYQCHDCCVEKARQSKGSRIYEGAK